MGAASLWRMLHIMSQSKLESKKYRAMVIEPWIKWVAENAFGDIPGAYCLLCKAEFHAIISTIKNITTQTT